MNLDQFQAVLVLIRDRLINDEFPKNAAEINNGYCADFATLVWEELDRHPDISILDDSDHQEYSHTFLEFQGMYYDAECIEGIDDWTQLPTFHR